MMCTIVVQPGHMKESQPIQLKHGLQIIDSRCCTPCIYPQQFWVVAGKLLQCRDDRPNVQMEHVEMERGTCSSLNTSFLCFFLNQYTVVLAYHTQPECLNPCDPVPL